MGRLTFKTLLLSLSLLASGCHNTAEVTQETSLPETLLLAPASLRASAVTCDPYACSITFWFNAVEFAESYLLYGSLSNDSSTASPLAAAQFSPIGWSYSHANPYGGVTYYFWVRAYDGKKYGKWPTSVSSILY